MLRNAAAAGRTVPCPRCGGEFEVPAIQPGPRTDKPARNELGDFSEQHEPDDLPRPGRNRRRHRKKRPTSTRGLKIALFICLGVAGLAGIAGGVYWVVTSISSGNDSKDQVTAAGIRVSRKTTFVDGPIDKDGFVDYPAAINARLSKGITPKTNAVTLLLPLVPPSTLREPLRSQFFEKTGVANAGGVPHFLSIENYSAERGNPGLKFVLMNEDRVAAHGPWSRRQCPQTVAWLDANRAALEVVVRASRRPDWYYPMIPVGMDGVLAASPLHLPQESRAIAWALVKRALLAVGEGRFADARDDLMACHRLARLLSQGATVIEALVGVALESIACNAEVAMLQSGRLPPQELSASQNALERLAPLTPMASKYDLGERLTALSSAMYVARNRFEGWKAVVELSVGQLGVTVNERVPDAVFDKVDWNVPLKMLNEEFDAVYAALNHATYAECRASILERKQHLDQLTNEARRSTSRLNEKDDRETLSKNVGRKLVLVFLPSFEPARVAGERATVRRQCTIIAFALERFRKAQGRFPDSLEQLKPGYLTSLALDPFSGEPYHYHLSGRGYVLYSVGQNGRDDRGLTFDSTPRGDDATIRMNAVQ
jgi:hypothetical protein